MNNKNQRKKITAEEFDKIFDEGGDITPYVDFSQGVRKVNIDLPIWAIKELDKEALRRGIARQALMKTWLIDKIDSLKEKRAS
ncbi:MAG: hypothetical protein KA715_04835 [Xanthomonadaceae bacterium]|nr:hypothetical protein [Xanthomonadaceae bacterium]